jgi:hypothetical protein
MSDLNTASTHVNAHGTLIQSITVQIENKIYEFQYQYVNGEWIRFRRIAHRVH